MAPILSVPIFFTFKSKIAKSAFDINRLQARKTNASFSNLSSFPNLRIILQFSEPNLTFMWNQADIYHLKI